MSENGEGEKASLRDALKNIIFFFITIGCAYWITIVIGIDRLGEIVKTAGIWAPLAVIVLKMTTIIVVPLGGGPIYAIAGVAFGFWKGLLFTFIGDVLGFSVAFYLSRFFGRSIVTFFIPKAQIPFFEKILARSAKPSTFFKARLAFAGLPEIFAYAAGLTKISFPLFLVSMMALHTPGTTIGILFGNALVSGNLVFVIGASVVVYLALFIGGWWFHRDITQEA
ncbi:MAG: VTT domain-containing protein [Patescibacteria group bacterium]|nr:VTT domain-containing protein [Patescibacteria group bacterium]